MGFELWYVLSNLKNGIKICHFESYCFWIWTKNAHSNNHFRMMRKITMRSQKRKSLLSIWEVFQAQRLRFVIDSWRCWSNNFWKLDRRGRNDLIKVVRRKKVVGENCNKKVKGLFITFVLQLSFPKLMVLSGSWNNGRGSYAIFSWLNLQRYAKIYFKLLFGIFHIRTISWSRPNLGVPSNLPITQPPW